MSDALGTIEKGALALGRILRDLVRPLDSGAPGPALQVFVADLGWALPAPVPPALIGLKGKVVDLAHDVAHLEEAIEGGDEGAILGAALDVAVSLAGLIDILSGLKPALTAQLPAPFVAATGLPDVFAERVVQTLVADALREAWPVPSRILRLIGLMEVSARPEDPAKFQPEFTLRTVRWDRFGQMFSDPVQLMEDAYGWGTPNLDLAPLHDALFSLSFGLGFPGTYDFPDEDLLTAIAPSVPNPKPDRSFTFTLFDVDLARADLLVTSVPKANPGELQGLAIAINAEGGALKVDIPISGTATFHINASLDASAGVALVLKPGQIPKVVTNLAGGGSPITGGELIAGISFARPEGQEPFSLLALPGGAGITARELSAMGGLAVGGKGGIDPRVEVALKQGRLAIKTDDADSFLSTLLPKDGIQVDFDLAIGWSNEAGLYVEGNAGLTIAIPLHLSLGPVEITTLYLDLAVDGGGLDLSTSIGATGALGPLSASIDKVGLKFDLTFPPDGGNLGPANLGIAFKPPNGVGLSIDAGAVKGGGYLFIDVDRGEYAGALELSILDFLSVTAIGIINTKMPDGSDGFSFLAIIGVEFNPGVQLGFGFTLIGVGGLVGLNRSMNLDALAKGACTGALDSVLFPKDVVANAPRIISDLKTFFPPEDGVFLIGPMAKLGWGTPTLLSLSLGIIIEIPGDIAIVGKLVIAVPDEKAALIIIKVAFMGAIEIDKKRGWFFATLYESRIIFMPLDGSMGVLAQFGDDANFVVSVGGFHPAYNPPSLPFPALSRIGINILNTPVARIRVECYFAVTSNTVQFGARAELYFGISIASVEGHLAFDALFQFSPFYFIITISASLSVKLFGAGLFSVRFRGTLEGTSPWHVEGTGSISILFWDVDVDFSHSWGESEDTRLPPVSVMPILAGELAKVENWTARLANANKLLVSLRPIDASAELVLHPLGTLRITQRAIPLGIPLDKVGSRRPDDAKLFSLAAATAGLGRRGEIRESFAIAQFQDLGDSARLGAADYEKEEAGIELEVTGNQTETSYIAKRIARYEQIIIDTNYQRLLLQFAALFAGLFSHFLANNACARSGLSARARDHRHLFDDKIAIHPNAYVVVSQADNGPIAGVPDSFASQASAKAYMAARKAADPDFGDAAHIVRPHEMKLAA